MLAVLMPNLAAAAVGDLSLISRRSTIDGGAGGSDNSYVPVMSNDGNVVAFSSAATNLTAANASGLEIYVRDIAAGTTSLVSRDTGGNGGNGASDYPDISANGNVIVFESAATDLGPVDGNGTDDIYMRNLTNGTTTLVSTTSGGSAAGGESASVSADGRFVVFESDNPTLGSPNGPASQDIFMRDMQTGTTTTISNNGAPAADGDSYDPEISDDGRWVVYSSYADNLSAEDANGVEDVFLRDNRTGTTTLISRQSASIGGAGGNDGSNYPAISADGRSVAFSTDATNLGATTSDSQYVVRDVQANTTTLVSKASDSAGGAVSNGSTSGYRPQLSDDGRYIVFNSAGSNLAAPDTDTDNDTFVRDTAAGTTALISKVTESDGIAPADSSSEYYPDITGDGRWVSFESAATNLSSFDLDGFDDAFRADFLGPPPAVDTTGPALSGKATGKAKAGKTLKIVVSSDEAATVNAGATAKVGKKKVKFKGASGSVAAGGSITLKLKLAKKPAKLLKKAGKGKANVSVAATDAAGNESNDSFGVKLK